MENGMRETENSVLVVDDEPSNLQILSHILKDDYTIYTAASGEHALEKAVRYNPDLILLDVLMPGMDGYQVLNRLKGGKETANIPAIFVSGLGSAEDEKRGLSLGAVDYIVKPFSSAIVQLRVGNQIKIVNQLRTIERLSLIDQLTGLPNRRSFDLKVNEEWKRAVREDGSGISILVIDVDHFKHFNDTYGHQSGDVALQSVAGVIGRSARRSADFAARWGGEEFVVLLPDTKAEGAVEIAESVRCEIAAMELRSGLERPVRITASVGANTEKPTQISRVESFISLADKALYAAKAAGRNRVIHVGNLPAGIKGG